jgi:hypothetical protein
VLGVDIKVIDMKKILFLTTSTLAFVGLGFVAQAAPAPAPSACGISGIVSGTGGYQGGSYSASNAKSVNLQSSIFGGGETALGYGCSNWMVQLDGAYYTDSLSAFFAGKNYYYQENKGHLGGAAFLRDDAMGRVGVAASDILFSMNENVAFPVPAGSLTRIGAFGDYYASNSLTFGAGAFYVGGMPDNSFGASQSGFEGNIHAKFYATDNISLGLQGDLQLANLTGPGMVGTFIDPWNGYAVTAEAEYLVPNTPVSVLLGGRFASRSITDTGNTQTYNDTQGWLGVKWAFGDNVTSLRARDRSGTYDNTSVFNEKLPSRNTDGYNSFFSQ